MPYKYFDSKVIDIQDISPTVKHYVIEVPDEMKFSFKAGQFIMLDLPINSNVTNRSYSVASAPNGSNRFELCIVLKPDGLGTPYLFNHVKPGSTVKVSKALGKFFLPEPLIDDLCMICTGTGIAPFRAYLWDIYNRNVSHKNIYLISGNRYRQDILYKKELEKFEELIPGFKFIPVLSREEDWTGTKGYVHPVYEKLFEDKRPAWFYICGWESMLRETRKRLEAMNYDRKRIKFESYD